MRRSIWSAVILVLLVSSIAMYLTSLCLVAFTHDRGEVLGIEALGLGWLPAFFGLIGIFKLDFSYFGALSWLANPLMLIAWVALLFKSFPLARVAAVSALCVSFLFFLTVKIQIPEGQTMEHVSSGAGCLLWIGSAILTLLAVLIDRLRRPEA